MIDKIRFQHVKENIIEKERKRSGIGTLSEKTVHAILKNYYEPDEDKQEIPIGKYVADIYSDGKITEIQTRQFNKMREKLTQFLPFYPVTIVYPIPREKWLIWIDKETGEMTQKRKSPKKGNPYEVFIELYRIKMFLKDPNLRIRIVMMDMEEYKLLNGWSTDKKKGSTRYDRIPLDIVEEIEVEDIRDYLQFVPITLPREFTSKEFAKEAHIPLRLAQTTLNILFELGTVERMGKKGRTFLYKVPQD